MSLGLYLLVLGAVPLLIGIAVLRFSPTRSRRTSPHVHAGETGFYDAGADCTQDGHAGDGGCDGGGGDGGGGGD